jgi:RNase P/RNase MRP subunit p30
MYLLYENLHDNADQKGMAYDILLLNSPFNYKSVLRKLAGKNIGFEILISKLKYCNSYEVGAWFSEVKYIHYLCKKYRHQLILSSGASNAYELISAKMFNSFLNKLDISPNEYWSSLNEWLENKHRGIVYDLE